jgi:hypothetical protein
MAFPTVDIRIQLASDFGSFWFGSYNTSKNRRHICDDNSKAKCDNKKKLDDIVPFYGLDFDRTVFCTFCLKAVDKDPTVAHTHLQKKWHMHNRNHPTRHYKKRIGTREHQLRLAKRREKRRLRKAQSEQHEETENKEKVETEEKEVVVQTNPMDTIETTENPFPLPPPPSEERKVHGINIFPPDETPLISMGDPLFLQYSGLWGDDEFMDIFMDHPLPAMPTYEKRCSWCHQAGDEKSLITEWDGLDPVYLHSNECYNEFRDNRLQEMFRLPQTPPTFTFFFEE